jgi:hypothetical protein
MEKIFVKNKFNFLTFILFMFLLASAEAQEVNSADNTKSIQSGVSSKITSNTGNSKKALKKVTLNFDEEVIKGTGDSPNLILLNSSKMSSFKDLYKKRTNFMDKVEQNKGLFNGK